MRVSLKVALCLSVCGAALTGCGGGGGSAPAAGGGGPIALESNFGGAFAALFNRDPNTDAGELDPNFTLTASLTDEPIDF